MPFDKWHTLTTLFTHLHELLIDLHCFIIFCKSVIKMQFLLSNLQFVYTVNKNYEYDKEVHE